MSKSEKTPKPSSLTVIIVHYQGTVTDKEFIACLQSVIDQDYEPEVLIYHDGPFLRPIPKFVTATKKRFNDFGHSLRERGIKEATGDYLLFLNADNILYPNVLGSVVAELGNSPIYICPLVMRYCVRSGGVMTRTGNYKDMVKLTGKPPVYENIDCMQLIMKTDLWRQYGWYDKSQNSDGRMYERFCKEHPYKHLDTVLGEHR